MSRWACQGGSSLLEPGTLAWGGGCVLPRGWSERPDGPARGAAVSKNRAHQPGGRGVQPSWWSGYPSWSKGRHHSPRTGHTSLEGTGSPAEVVVGVSVRAHGEAFVFINRAHRPRGGRGVQPRGWSDYLSGPMGRQHRPKNRAHQPGGDGESSPGGGRSILQGPRGGNCVLEPGSTAWGGRGVQPRGWSKYPLGPMGRQHYPRTGYSSFGGTESPAQAVVGVLFRARGEACSKQAR